VHYYVERAVGARLQRLVEGAGHGYVGHEGEVETCGGGVGEEGFDGVDLGLGAYDGADGVGSRAEEEGEDVAGYVAVCAGEEDAVGLLGGHVGNCSLR